MVSILREFRLRRSMLEPVHWPDAGDRLSGLFDWIQSQPEVLSIMEEINKSVELKNNFDISEKKIQASTAEEVAGVGFSIISMCKKGLQPHRLASEFNVYPVTRPKEGIYSEQSMAAELFSRFINPALGYMELELEKIEEPSTDDLLKARRSSEKYPLEITQSLNKFLSENPDKQRNAFIMMQFGETDAHNSIMKGIRKVLTQYGIKAFRADEKDYHDDLFPNVLTYIYGCDFGIAVFERLQDENFNPNVSLEMGYMRALKKRVCLLKDKTLKTLQADLGGILYKQFDTQDAEGTIPDVLEKWLRDREIITG